MRSYSRSFQRLQLPFELVLPSFIIVGVGLQPQSSRFVIRCTIHWQLILWWRFYVLSMRYADNNETMEYDDAWWVICSVGVGGSIGAGWMLLLQPERCRRVFKFYAIKICKSVVQLLKVWVPAYILSMQYATINRLYIYYADSGVLLMSLRCLFVV